MEDYSKLEYEELFKLAYEEGDSSALNEVYHRREIRFATLVEIGGG